LLSRAIPLLLRAKPFCGDRRARFAIGEDARVASSDRWRRREAGVTCPFFDFRQPAAARSTTGGNGTRDWHEKTEDWQVETGHVRPSLLFGDNTFIEYAEVAV
jgi:hypothetical protein